MEDLLTLARTSAHEAANIVMSYYGTAMVREKIDKSPVTDADIHAHDFLLTSLAQSNVPILSEEGGDVSHPYPDRLWIIDPIDGTSGFINRSGDFSVMIGLLEHGRPVLGVIHAPAHGTQYYAAKGTGAYMTKEGVTTKLSVGSRVPPELRGVASRNHRATYMEKAASLLHVDEVLRMGGIGTKAAFLAEDKGDYFLTLGQLGEWDVCAPEILLTEAGGMVTDKDGTLLAYDNHDSLIKNGVIFSNNACHADIVRALRASLPIALPL